MSHPIPEGLGSVIIGPREIYDAVVRVSAKVDLLSMQMTQQTADLQDQENRIRNLERGRWPIQSVTVLIAIGAVVIAWLRP